MTAPAPTPPPLNEPLMSIEELAKWVQLPEISEDQQPFAFLVMEGAAVVVREAGSPWWVYPGDEQLPAGHIRIPYRAKLLYDLKVKNFFEHPTGAISETVGPLSERYLDEVVAQLVLTEDEKKLLAELADDGGPEAPYPAVTGIWALSTYRGALETHDPAVRGIVHVPWWRPYWPYDAPGGSLPYYADGALGSPSPNSEMLP